MGKITVEDLEQQIIGIYDAHNGNLVTEDVCAIVQRTDGCRGIDCDKECPLSIAYLIGKISQQLTPSR